jgi:hypothetical protein
LLKKKREREKKMKGKVAFNYKFCQWISFQKRKEVDFFSFFWTKKMGFAFEKTKIFFYLKMPKLFGN